MQRQGGTGARLLAKLEAYFGEGKFYEAQQIYKTQCYRYTKSKQWAEATKLLTEGCMRLLQHKQTNAAKELGILLVQTLKDSGVQAQQEHFDTFEAIFKKFPADDMDPGIIFLKAAIKWSAERGPDQHGDSHLHHLLAETFTTKKEYAKASRAYLRAADPFQHAQLLADWSKLGAPGEADMFITRAVLQYLLLQKVAEAQMLLDEVPCVFADKALLDTPLYHFCKFLTLAATIPEGGRLFTMLRDTYKPALARDPQLVQYLDKVGQGVFKVEPPGGGGLLNIFNMAQDLFSDGM